MVLWGIGYYLVLGKSPHGEGEIIINELYMKHYQEMYMKSWKNIVFFSMLLALYCLSCVQGAIAAGGGPSVAILPFKLNAPPDKQYLQEGLRDMLGSRMTAEAGAAIVPKAKVDGALQKAGGKLVAQNMSSFAKNVGADYLVFGSISALGGGMSIDANVYTAGSDDQAVKTFYGSATSNDQIMKSIDTLSWDIIEKLFNKQRPASLAPTPTAQAKSDVPAFTTAHPDKTFMTSGGGYSIRGGRNFVKTRNFDMGIRGFELGDIDGDGTLEVILANKSEVMVFRRDGTRLNLLGTVKMAVRYQVHSVNAADVNGNGKAEIYISANDPKMPGSRAVEWDGEKFVDLFREARFYIKPMDLPGIGLSLLGQGSGMVPVTEGIYRLSTASGRPEVQERLPIPNTVNLFNFVYADIEGDGSHEIIALDNSFKLLVFKGGSLVWKSEERFCGTKRFLGGSPDMMPGTSPLRNDEVDGVGELYVETFVPSRILVSDVDHDGVDDIILNRNPDTLSTVVPRMVQYQSGTMVGLKWNGLGLEELWRTRKIDGYVVDYQVKSQIQNLESNADDELFIGIVLNAGTFDSLLGDQSTVVIYPFAFEQPANQ